MEYRTGSSLRPRRPSVPTTSGCSGIRAGALVSRDRQLTDGGKEFARVGLPPFPSQGDDPRVVFANARDGFAYVEGSTPLYVTHDGGELASRGPSPTMSARLRRRGGRLRRLGPTRSSGRGSAKIVAKLSSLAALHLPVLTGRSWVGRLVPRAASSRKPDSTRWRLRSDHGRRPSRGSGPCLAELGRTLVPAADGVVWAVCPSGMMAGLVPLDERGPFVPDPLVPRPGRARRTEPDQRRTGSRPRPRAWRS